jgi:hypothetical protein
MRARIEHSDVATANSSPVDREDIQGHVRASRHVQPEPPESRRENTKRTDHVHRLSDRRSRLPAGE